MNTIWSLKPGLKGLRLFGYLPFRITRNHQVELGDLHRYYSILLICIFGTLSCYSFFFKQLENDLESTVNFLLLVLVNFTILITLLETLHKRQAQKEILDNFQAIDDILQTKFSHTIQVHLRRHFSSVILMYVLILALILAADIAIILKSNATEDLKSLAYYFVGYAFSSMRYLQINYVVWMIRKRLVFLNSTLVELIRQKETNSAIKTVSFKSTIQTIRFLNMELDSGGVGPKNRIAPFDQKLATLPMELTALDVLRDVYHKLWINSQLFNKAFGLSVLVNIGFDFLALTTNLYWIIVSFSTVVVNISPTPALYG